MIKFISMANQKGGVAKTTSSVTIGHGLANQGLDVLIVDMDPQGHVAKMLNQPKGAGIRKWYYDEAPLSECTVQAREHLDILTADKTIERVLGKIRSAADEGRNGPRDFASALRQDAAQVGYDVVLMDLAPSLSVIQVAALLASDIVIIPTRLRYADMDGVNELMKTIGELSQQGHKMEFYLLPTFYDRSTNETTERLKELWGKYPNRVWAPIVQDTKLSEAPGRGLTVWEYAPDTNGVIGYVNGGGKRVGGYANAVEQVTKLI